MTTDLSLIYAIEERAANALPAPGLLLYDGWHLRFANGYPRRANSVWFFQPSTLPLEEKIDFCESQYWAGGRAVFRLTPLVDEALPDRLAARGYTHEAPTQVSITESMALPTTLPPHHGHIELCDHITPEWTDDNGRLHAFTPEQSESYGAIYARIVTPTAFVRIHGQNGVVGVAAAVVERGWMGVFSVVTDPAARGQGHATAALAALFTWGQNHGATRAYLQVMESNAVALRLYARFGFTRLYGYRYLQKDPP